MIIILINEKAKPQMCCNDDKDFALNIPCNMCNNICGEVCRRLRCCHIEGSKKWIIKQLQNATSLYLTKDNCSLEEYNTRVDNHSEQINDILSQMSGCLDTDLDIVFEIVLIGKISRTAIAKNISNINCDIEFATKLIIYDNWFTDVLIHNFELKDLIALFKTIDTCKAVQFKKKAKSCHSIEQMSKKVKTNFIKFMIFTSIVTTSNENSNFKIPILHDFTMLKFEAAYIPTIAIKDRSYNRFQDVLIRFA